MHPEDVLLMLVHSSMFRKKIIWLLLNPKLNSLAEPHLQYPGTDLTREAEEYDLPIVGTHPSALLLKNRDHHPDLAIQRHCSWFAVSTTTVLQHPEPYAGAPLHNFPSQVFALLCHIRSTAPFTFLFCGNFHAGFIGCSSITSPRPDWISSRFDIQFWAWHSMQWVARVIRQVVKVLQLSRQEDLWLTLIRVRASHDD